jgi:hypothetical protein
MNGSLNLEGLRKEYLQGEDSNQKFLDIVTHKLQ